MGRPIAVSIPHKLGKVEARRRLEEGFGSMRQNMTAGLGAMFSVSEHWEGDRLHFDVSGIGQQLSGRLDVLPESIEAEIDVPAFLALLAEQILGKLKTGTQKLLEGPGPSSGKTP